LALASILILKISVLVFPGLGGPPSYLALRTYRGAAAAGRSTATGRAAPAAGAATARAAAAASGAAAMVAIAAAIVVVVAILVLVVISVVTEAKPGPRRMATTIVIAGKGRG